jgi:L-rhamnose-H+ transport protein
MIIPNPIIGTGLHAIGGISASTCYIPFNKTKKWSWESYWLIQAFFAWLIMPLLIGIFTVPQLMEVLRNSPLQALLIPFILGAVYGFGGMSFGYAIRHIGFSLTYTISIGISAVLGTITPLILKGTLIQHFQKPGGLIVLGGMILSMLGVALCGSAGYKKEKDLKSIGTEKSAIQFNMKKGLILTLVAGLLSAVFGISLEFGQPISDVAAEYGAGYFEGNAKIIVSTAGCFLTNLIWFVVQGFKQGSLKEIVCSDRMGRKSLMNNYLLAAFGGSLWYLQFFFYGLGHVRMGSFMFASWVIHMSMLIFFSYIIGLALKEWKNVKRKTYTRLILALMTLVISFVVMTYGSMQSENVNPNNAVVEKPVSQN